MVARERSEKVDELREDTPATRDRIHFNNAGAALMPRPVLRSMVAQLELEAAVGGYEAADAQRELISRSYASTARLLSCGPENIAFAASATDAFARALSSIPFAAGDVILTTRDDYASNQIAFMSLRRRFGVRIVHAPDSDEGGVDVDRMRRLMHAERPRAVVVTHVPTNSGLVQPVAEIGACCRELDLLYLVDACQSVGQLPLNVQEIGCDFLSATSRKFLRGPRGAGFLYVSDRVLADGYEPLFIDMHGAVWSADDGYTPSATAARFEDWEFAYAAVIGSGVAAQYCLDTGMAWIEGRSRKLASRLRRGLAEIDGIRVLDRGTRLGAIVTFAPGGWEAQAFKAELDARRINSSLSFREHAQLDFADKQVDWCVRLSPHYYNTEDEVAEVVAAVEELARDARR